jgi:hypothetical protein
LIQTQPASVSEARTIPADLRALLELLQAEGRVLHIKRTVLPENMYLGALRTEAVVDGVLVTGPAWTAHPAWRAKFLVILQVSGKLLARMPRPHLCTC